MPSNCKKNHSVAKREKAEALDDLLKTTKLLKEELTKCNVENRRQEVVVNKLKRGSMSKVTAVVTPSPITTTSQSATSQADFSNEELETGIIKSQKPSTRKNLDPMHVNNFKEKKVRFRNEREAAHRATNQHCRKIKAKRNNAHRVINLLAE